MMVANEKMKLVPDITVNIDGSVVVYVPAVNVDEVEAVLIAERIIANKGIKAALRANVSRVVLPVSVASDVSAPSVFYAVSGNVIDSRMFGVPFEDQ